MKTLLLVLGGMKLLPLLKSGGTMILALGAYAWVWGWPYAAGFVGLLLIHELGHYVAARTRGLDVGLPMFLPFVGAWIELKDRTLDPETEAYVAAAGPFVGTIASVFVYFAARHLGSDLLLAIAYAGLMLNLFNLLPIAPLDGGRILGVVSPRLWLLGAPILIALFVWRPSPMLLLVGVLCVPALARAWRFDPRSDEDRRYRDVRPAARVEYGALYVGLAGFLAVLAHDVHAMLA